MALQACLDFLLEEEIDITFAVLDQRIMEVGSRNYKSLGKRKNIRLFPAKNKAQQTSRYVGGSNESPPHDTALAVHLI